MHYNLNTGMPFIEKWDASPLPKQRPCPIRIRAIDYTWFDFLPDTLACLNLFLSRK